MSENPDSTRMERSQEDRRRNPKLRALFERAYEVVFPFFDPSNNWGGHSLEHLAFRVLRETFPDLTPAEAEEVVAAAQKVFATRHGPSGRHPFKR